MKLSKPYTNQQYASLAAYCNQNNLVIGDKGDYLESVNPPEPSVEELQANVRQVRNSLLEQTDKYLSVQDFPIMSETKEQYKSYRQYLRDYPETENWWKSEPLTFEEWRIEQATSEDTQVDNTEQE